MFFVSQYNLFPSFIISTVSSVNVFNNVAICCVISTFCSVNFLSLIHIFIPSVVLSFFSFLYFFYTCNISFFFSFLLFHLLMYSIMFPFVVLSVHSVQSISCH